MIPNAWMSCDAMVFNSSCLSSIFEMKNKCQNQVPRGNQGEKKSNSRSKFNPLLNNTSRYPVAEVIQIRSLDGTVYEGEVSERG